MKIVNSIPKYEAVTHRLKGRVEHCETDYYVGGLFIPKNLERKFKARTHPYGLQEGVDSKNIILRGKSNHQGNVEWFGLVSEKFTSMPIADLGQALYGIKGVDTQVRYDSKKERFVVSYGIGKNPERTHMFLDSGDFGTYGGNGEMSIRIGVALYGRRGDRVGTVLAQNIGERFIHRRDHNELSEVVDSIRVFGAKVEKEFGGDLRNAKEVVNYARQLSLI
jgi:hypothetical protein